MKPVLRMEFKKSFHNAMFLITLGIAAALAVWSGISAVSLYTYDHEMTAVSIEKRGVSVNPDYGLITLFNKWIGQDHVAMATSLFYLLLPIIAVLPYAWSYFSERKSGYVRSIVTRMHRHTYFLSKYIVTFISGAAVVLIPMIINFLLVSAYIPAASPDVQYSAYYSMPVGAMGSVLFYEHPFWFVVLRMVLGALFAGLIATSVIALSFFVKNRFAVLLSPFLALLVINYFSGAIADYINGIEISPLKFIHGGNTAYPKLWVVLLYIGLLFCFSFGVTLWKGRKTDVF